MVNILSFFLFLFCHLLLPSWGVASEAELLQQLKQIQQTYRSLTSLSFDFRQLTRSNGRERRGAGSGIFYRPAPGKSGIMRWNYAAPDAQIILNDSKKLSVYTEKDNQLIVSSAAGLESDIIYAFFAGNRNLTDDFDAQPAERRFTSSKNSAGLRVMRLAPKKPHGQIKATHCWFDRDAVIRKIVLEDHFDTLTELAFSNINFDALPASSEKTAAELVRLELPPGTEVLRQ